MNTWQITALSTRNHEFFETRDVIEVPAESIITNEPIILKGLDGTVNEYPKGTWIVTQGWNEDDFI